MLQQAIAAIKSGEREKGQALLEQVLQKQPANELALLWMSTLVETRAEQIEYLRRVLAINPDNRPAQRGLAALEKAGDGVEASAGPPPPPPSLSPRPAEILASGSADNNIMLWDVKLEEWIRRACRIANRNLTREEWDDFIGPEQLYQLSCPELSLMIEDR